jgi:pyruvate ferredoxin oxidoreductase delta subunit
MLKQQETPMKTPGKRNVLGPCAIEFTAANTGSWRIERPVVNEELCIRCGTCSRYCPSDCISINSSGTPVVFDWYYCKGCGICANECPKHAITLVSERGEN